LYKYTLSIILFHSTKNKHRFHTYNSFFSIHSSRPAMIHPTTNNNNNDAGELFLPSLRTGRRPAKNRAASRRYRALRQASGPTTGQFGVRTHVDAMHREYHVISKTNRTELACRITRSPDAAESMGMTQQRSRQGGEWQPRWPGLDSILTLFRLRDQVLEQAIVDEVWAMPIGTTARILLKGALRPIGPPLRDPRPFLAWVPTKTSRRQRGNQKSRGFVRRVDGGFPASSAESL